MKALSLWQPWASAMALGLKRVETRHWSTTYRGPLAIHAAKRWTRDEREFAEMMGLPTELPLGAIVAVGNLRSCLRTEAVFVSLSMQEESWGNYSDGRFAWVFDDIRALPEPVLFKGAQGFFDVPDELFTSPVPLSSQGRLL